MQSHILKIINMSKNLAIIGASYLQLPLIKKAKELGFTTHVFAWAANDVGEKEADFFYPISITEKDAICEKCKEIEITGICSIASDLAAITVNYVANKLNLNGNSLTSTLKSTNKHEMRKAFEANNDPSPKSFLITKVSDIENINLTYPIIVKPTDRSGSRGIYKLEKSDNLSTAIESALSESFEKKILIEEFAEGKEYSVECISFHGKHHFLAMTTKYTTDAPHFIETGHKQPCELDTATIEKAKNIVFHALDSLEITNSASHSEIKIDTDGNIKIIEIGGRMGGDCIGSDLVRYSTGIDFVRAVIQVACNQEPDLSKVCEPQPVEVKFIFTKSDLDELNNLKNNTPEQLLQIVDYHPEKIGHTTDSSNRAGCYIKKL